MFLDHVVLHGADGGDVVLADWETPGDVEGWIANRTIKDATFVVQVRQSAAPAAARESGVIGSVAVSRSNPRVVLAASSLFGVLKSEDAGESWRVLPTPAAAPQRGVAAWRREASLRRSAPRACRSRRTAAATWSAANAGIKPGYAILEVVIAPDDPQTVYAIGAKGWDGQFYRSSDGGRNWQGARLMKGDREADPTNPEDYVVDTPLSTPTNLSINPSNPQRIVHLGQLAAVLQSRTAAGPGRSATAGRTSPASPISASAASGLTSRPWTRAWR